MMSMEEENHFFDVIHGTYARNFVSYEPTIPSTEMILLSKYEGVYGAPHIPYLRTYVSQEHNNSTQKQHHKIMGS